jgi:hypothetical protein
MVLAGTEVVCGAEIEDVGVDADPKCACALLDGIAPESEEACWLVGRTVLGVGANQDAEGGLYAAGGGSVVGNTEGTWVGRLLRGAAAA